MEIKGKVHCFFEQSGTFKNEFIKLGIPAEHPSEDLDDEIYNYWRNELTTEDIVTISKDDFIFHATHFANWQKEQMMKSAIDAKIVNDEMSGCVVDCEQGCLVLEPHTYPIGQKLKILIIKEATNDN